MDFVDYPQHAMHFHLVNGREFAKRAVPAEEDAAGMALRERKCKSVMDGDGGNRLHDLPHSENPIAGQVHDFESAPHQCIFLGRCKLQQFLFEESVGDQKFIWEPQKGFEEAHLPEVDEATAIAHDDTH